MIAICRFVGFRLLIFSSFFWCNYVLLTNKECVARWIIY